MVNGKRGGAPRSGILVFGLLALGALEACGSRSPLLESFGEGVAGDGETGGSGGSLGGGSGGDYAGGVGGVGYGGLGGAYPMGSGGTSPMSAGGTYPTAGYGGVGVSVGGAYPMGVGGAYPSAGYGGKGMGVGGAMPGGGGKGMGAGGKGGGGKGDPRVYKGCLLACQKYESFCPGLAGDCLSECTSAGGQYPECSALLADWLFCIGVEFQPRGPCDQADCSGDGCLTEAQDSCTGYVEDLSTCLAGESICATITEIAETTCRIQSYCGPNVYDTQCWLRDESGPVMECQCMESSSAGVSRLEGFTVDDACYEMNAQCGFPSGR